MISYQPFWDTIQKKGITTYVLINKYKVSRSLIDKLKHNKGLNTSTLNDLCHILNCSLIDIAEFVND
ncbi:MAG: helix-turn-helix transcriptional regulator [Lachnospiraceae bacterium]|nr:helix-turn-helix transcriptional regulator [Lachnospiraceae bacterium]